MQTWEPAPGAHACGIGRNRLSGKLVFLYGRVRRLNLRAGEGRAALGSRIDPILR